MLETPQIVWLFRARLYGGETPQTPLSVFDVGFAHVRGRPPKTPQIVWSFYHNLNKLIVDVIERITTNDCQC